MEGNGRLRGVRGVRGVLIVNCGLERVVRCPNPFNGAFEFSCERKIGVFGDKHNAAAGPFNHVQGIAVKGFEVLV